MSRSMGILCALAILLAGAFSGCTQRRFVVGSHGPECSIPFCPMCDGEKETFVETQPPLVDSSSADSVEVVDAGNLPRELPAPNHASSPALSAAQISKPGRLAGIEEAAPIAAVPLHPASVTPQQSDELPSLSASSLASTAEPVPAPGVAIEQSPQPIIDEDEDPIVTVRSDEDAALDREFAQLRAQRDALKQSFQRTSSATNVAGRAMSNDDFNEMLVKLATQVSQLSSQPAPDQLAAAQPETPPAQTAVLVDKEWEGATSGNVELTALVSAEPAASRKAAEIPAPDDLLGIGRRLFEQGRYRDAEHAFRGAVRLATTDQDRALATYLLATSESRQGKRSSAAQSYRLVAKSSDASLAAMARWQLEQLDPRRDRR